MFIYFFSLPLYYLRIENVLISGFGRYKKVKARKFVLFQTISLSEGTKPIVDFFGKCPFSDFEPSIDK